MRVTLRTTVLLSAAVATASVLVGLDRTAPAGGSAPPEAAAITPISPTAPWRTVFTGTKSGVEGLTSDNDGNLYVAERAGGSDPCPVWKISAASDEKTQVGVMPGPCSPSGLAFGPDGRLYLTGGNAPMLDQIDVLQPGDATAEATVFATGVPQANGIAFDRHGNLWASDGLHAQGIVYRVPPEGGAATEVFRVPAMTNSIGVGRQNQPLQGTTPNTGNSQNIVANGIAFTHSGDMIVADTARGALWKVNLTDDGQVTSRTGCDPTYAADTLCLNDLFLQSPYLVGADGIALDTAGRVWADANERQAVIVVSPDGRPTSSSATRSTRPATVATPARWRRRRARCLSATCCVRPTPTGTAATTSRTPGARWQAPARSHASTSRCTHAARVSPCPER